MLVRDDFLSLNFVKKEDYAGSYQGMRYMLAKVSPEEDVTKLKISLWPEPFGIAATREELIISELFDLNEDGFAKGIEWMNENYPEIIKKIEPII